MKNIKYISRFLYLVIVFCLILAATGNSVALAANDKVSGPAITYSEAKNAISFSGTGANNSDLFPKFKGLVPGDSVTQTITLISDKTNSNSCTFSMKAANNDKKDKDFLSYLYLSVEKNGMEISSGKAATGEGLNQWEDIGTLAAGESLTVKVSLNVDKDMNNDFQNYECKIRWMFRTVTADVVIPDQPSPPVTTINPENVPAVNTQKPQEATATLPEKEEVPLTGTASWALFNLLCAIVTVILCVVLLIVYLVKKKNNEENDNADAENKDTPADYRSRANKDTGDDDNNDETNKDKKKFGWRIASVVIAALAVIVFLLTEDIRLPMVWFDKWTITMVVILIIQIVDTMIVLYKKKERDEDINEV